MKLNEGFVLREIAGENLLIPVGGQAVKINGVIALSPVAAEIWKALREHPETDYALQKVLELFDVDEDAAKKDIDEFITQMEQTGICEL